MGRYGSKDFNYTMFNKDARSLVVSLNKILLAIVFTLLFSVSALQHTLIKVYKFDHRFSYLSTAFIILLAIYFQTIGRYTYLTLKEKV